MVFLRKNMIEDLESYLTGAPIDALNTEDYAVVEEANPDESITAVAKARNEMEIDVKEELNTEAYKETINIDIENIYTIEKSHKLYTKRRRKIYEVIQQEFFFTDIFPDDFLNIVRIM